MTSEQDKKNHVSDKHVNKRIHFFLTLRKSLNCEKLRSLLFQLKNAAAKHA